MVNLVGKGNKELIDYLGSHSGRNENKLTAVKAKISDAVNINAPIIDDCPVSIECTIVASIVTGSHEMFVGKVEYVHADPSMVKENGDIDFR